MKETSTPLPRNFSNHSEWYPPGHGDLYESLVKSGLLDEFITEGRDIVFISNIDNLGATVDERLWII